MAALVRIDADGLLEEHRPWLEGEVRHYLDEVVDPDYQGSTVWTSLGSMYLQLLHSIEPERARPEIDRYVSWIERDGTFWEVIDDETGLRYSSTFLTRSDESMLWSAIFLTPRTLPSAVHDASNRIAPAAWSVTSHSSDLTRPSTLGSMPPTTRSTTDTVRACLAAAWVLLDGEGDPHAHHVVRFVLLLVVDVAQQELMRPGPPHASHATTMPLARAVHLSLVRGETHEPPDRLRGERS